MKTKNLITDILQYLKENDEARERFNKGYFKKIYKSSGIFGNKRTFENDSVFYGWINIDDLKSKKGYLALHTVELQHFLLHALSSPNGKPICGFLEIEETIYNPYLNHASTLFSLLTSQIEQGKSFDEILIKLNDKYNKLNI